VFDADPFELRVLYRKPVVVRSVLQRATRLESLAIYGDEDEGLTDDKCLEVSELATYPGLAALSLRNILWEDGEIGHQGVVKPPAVEDFIVRHRKTLKTLKLHNCVIGISQEGRRHSATGQMFMTGWLRH
jgi:hypothetical protein